MPSSARGVVSPLVSLASIMDVGSVYSYAYVDDCEGARKYKKGDLGEVLDGMVGLAVVSGGLPGQLADVAENVSQVAMRVVDALSAVAGGGGGGGEGGGEGGRDVRDGVGYLRDGCLALSCVLGGSGGLRRFVVQQRGCFDRLLTALDEVHDGLVPKLYFYVGEEEEEEGAGGLRVACREMECAAGSAAGWLFDGVLTATLDECEAGGSGGWGGGGE